MFVVVPTQEEGSKQIDSILSISHYKNLRRRMTAWSSDTFLKSIWEDPLVSVVPPTPVLSV